jgi:hypothetical protein
VPLRPPAATTIASHERWSPIRVSCLPRAATTSFFCITASPPTWVLRAASRWNCEWNKDFCLLGRFDAMGDSVIVLGLRVSRPHC